MGLMGLPKQTQSEKQKKKKKPKIQILKKAPVPCGTVSIDLTQWT